MGRRFYDLTPWDSDLTSSAAITFSTLLFLWPLLVDMRGRKTGCLCASFSSASSVPPIHTIQGTISRVCALGGLAYSSTSWYPFPSTEACLTYSSSLIPFWSVQPKGSSSQPCDSTAFASLMWHWNHSTLQCSCVPADTVGFLRLSPPWDLVHLHSLNNIYIRAL